MLAVRTAQARCLPHLGQINSTCIISLALRFSMTVASHLSFVLFGLLYYNALNFADIFSIKPHGQIPENGLFYKENVFRKRKAR
jgi:hypothetical protein